MTIHAEVIEPGSDRITQLKPVGWWMSGTVVLESGRKTSPGIYEGDPDRLVISYRSDTPIPRHEAPEPAWKTYDFLVDTGSDMTQLGTIPVEQLGIRIGHTQPLPGVSTMADGNEVCYRWMWGELWLRHQPPGFLWQHTFSAFRLKFVIPESILLPANGDSSPAYADSLIGQDVLDYLMTYGQMYRTKPEGIEPRPVSFNIWPNCRIFDWPIRRIRWFSFENPSKCPHATERLAEARGLVSYQVRVRGVRRLNRDSQV